MKILWDKRSWLDLCLVGFVPLKLLFSSPSLSDTAAVILALIVLLFWGWVIVVAAWNFRFGEAATNILPYERLGSGDYWRWFVALWAGWNPLAAESALGFLIASVVGVATIVVGSAIVCCELWRMYAGHHNHKEAPLWLGMAAFVYFTSCWELQALRIHAGVPIPGHFLEKPDYDYACEATLQRLNAEYEPLGGEISGRAMVHVSQFTETETSGEDRFGQEITSSYSNRAYEVKQFTTSTGRLVKIAHQDERLDDSNESAVVEDSNGVTWIVSLEIPR